MTDTAIRRRRRSALESVHRPGRIGADGGMPGVVITERHPRTLVHVECRETDTNCIEMLANALGAPLPGAGKATAAAERRVLWLGPGRWLVDAPASEEIDLAAGLVAAAPAAAVNDVSSSRTVLRLSGPKWRWVLGAGCPLDLDQRTFGTDHVATSVCDQIVVTLDCIGDDSVDVYVARGFAVSFYEWLLAAGAEVGVEVQVAATS